MFESCAWRDGLGHRFPASELPMSPTPPRRQAPATAGLARQLYAEGLPIAEICARTGLSTGVAYHWIDREVGPDGAVALKPQARRARNTFPIRPEESPRGRLLARLWRTAERQVAEIEARMHHAAEGEGTPRPSADGEKDARALALIARTLRELTAAEDAAGKAARDTPAQPAKDADDTVRDLDEFRRELARRLERLRAEPEDDPPPAG